MTDDQAPPTPVPPASQAPYPAHPAPHVHSDIPVAKKQEPAPPAIGALGFSCAEAEPAASSIPAAATAASPNLLPAPRMNAPDVIMACLIPYSRVCEPCRET